MRIHKTVLEGITRENATFFYFTLIWPLQIFIEPEHSFVTNPDCLPGSNIFNGLVICSMVALVSFPLSSFAVIILKWISKINDDAPSSRMVDVTKSMTRCGLLVFSVLAYTIGFVFMLATVSYGLQYKDGTWICWDSSTISTLSGMVVLSFIIPGMQVFSLIWCLTY